MSDSNPPYHCKTQFYKAYLSRFATSLKNILSFISKNDTAFTAFILVCLNALVKGIFLSTNSLAGDEPFSIYHAQMHVRDIIALLSTGNNPPLYEILMHFWIKLFGISEFAVRVPSLLFSCVTVLFIYKIGKTYFANRIGIYTGLIFIFSNYHIFFAHEARVYALLGMLSVLSMYYYLHILRHCTATDLGHKSPQVALIILVVVNTLLIYAHYFGFFILIVQGLFFFLHKPLVKKYWVPFLGTIMLISLLYSPNIYVLFHRFIDSSSHGTWVTPPTGIESIYNMLRQLTNEPVVTVLSLMIFLVASIKLLTKRKTTNFTLYHTLIVFWFTFIFFFMFGISYFIPMFMDRYLMTAAVGFCMLVSLAADFIISHPKYRYVLPLLIIGLFVVTCKPKLSNERNVRNAVATVKKLQNPESLVVISPAHFAVDFVYYYDRSIFSNYSVDKKNEQINTSLNQQNVFAIDEIKEIDISQSDHVIYYDAAADFSNPTNHIKTTLDSAFELTNQTKFDEYYTVLEYERR